MRSPAAVIWVYAFLASFAGKQLDPHGTEHAPPIKQASLNKYAYESILSFLLLVPVACYEYHNHADHSAPCPKPMLFHSKASLQYPSVFHSPQPAACGFRRLSFLICGFFSRCLMGRMVVMLAAAWMPGVFPAAAKPQVCCHLFDMLQIAFFRPVRLAFRYFLCHTSAPFQTIMVSDR